MRSRLLMWSLVLLGAAGPPGLLAQGRPGFAEPSVVFHLPANVDPRGVVIDYQLSGGAEGIVSFLRTLPNVFDYPLVTSRDGRPFAALKGYAYGPGFGFVLVDVGLTAASGSRRIDLDFTPLGTVRLAGRIVLPDGRDLRGLALSVSYWPHWRCEFYDQMDCAYGPVPIAVTPFAPDGAFSVAVPDFAHDSALARFSSKGEFDLNIRDHGGSGNAVFDVQVGESQSGIRGPGAGRPDGSLPTRRDLPVAASYPPDQEYRAVAR